MTSKLCVYPWMHIHLHPKGDILPCCMADQKFLNVEKFINIKNNPQSMLEAMNSEGMKEMRRKMLNNQEPDECRICFDREKAGLESMRLLKNSQYQDRYQPFIEATEEDGTINEFKPSFVDLRFSNVCNLKCRMCGHGLSSSWWEEHKAITVLNDPSADTTNIPKFIQVDAFDKIKPFLHEIDDMYWAGGEPLMEKQHFYTLDYLIEKDLAKNIRMSYNTNITTLTHKRKNITEWWNHFKSVTVAASIDGMGDTFNYIRTNGDWNVAKRNFEFLRFEQSKSNVFIFPSITVSILNIHQFPKFLKWCAENKWFDNSLYLHINFVTHPQVFCIKNLTSDKKKEMSEFMTDYQEQLKQIDFANAANALESVKNFMFESSDYTDKNEENLMKSARSRLDMFDKTGNLNWRRSLPELASYLDNIR